MPWKESVRMEERLQFVRDAASDRYTMSERSGSAFLYWLLA